MNQNVTDLMSAK